MKKYSDEIRKFIAANVKGISCKALTELTNQKMGTSFTEKSMHAYKTNNKLKSGIRGGNPKGAYKIFTQGIAEFIKANVKDKYNKELTELVNNTFGTSYTVKQIDCFKTNHKIFSDLTGHFEPGHVPQNKGKKMPKEVYKKCSKTMFKKGNSPHNHRPVGSERKDAKDGFWSIKIAEPNKWQLKHVWLWEQNNGPVPEGHKVVFLDGNRENISIENLILASDAEMCEFNCRLKFKNKYPEITKSGIAVAKLKCAINKKKKEAKC